MTNLRAFLSWYFGASNALATAVIQNNGFNPLPASYTTVIRNKYLSATNAGRIAAAGTGVGGCTGVTGGAL